MKGIVSLKECVAIMRMGKPFSLEVCSFNEHKDTAGERKIYENALLVSSIFQNQTSSVPDDENGVLRRNPNHLANVSINIRLNDRSIETIHLPLIETINKMRVAL